MYAVPLKVEAPKGDDNAEEIEKALTHADHRAEVGDYNGALKMYSRVLSKSSKAMKEKKSVIEMLKCYPTEVPPTDHAERVLRFAKMLGSSNKPSLCFKSYEAYLGLVSTNLEAKAMFGALLLEKNSLAQAAAFIRSVVEETGYFSAQTEDLPQIRVAVIGPPGSGKSKLCRSLAEAFPVVLVTPESGGAEKVLEKVAEAGAKGFVFEAGIPEDVGALDMTLDLTIVLDADESTLEAKYRLNSESVNPDAEADMDKFSEDLKEYRPSLETFLDSYSDSGLVYLNAVEDEKATLEMSKKLLFEIPFKDSDPDVAAARRMRTFAWALMGLYFNQRGDRARGKRYFDLAQHVEDSKLGSPPYNWCKRKSTLLSLADELLKLSMVRTTEALVQEEIERNGQSIETSLVMTRIHKLKKNYLDAESVLRSALDTMVPEDKDGSPSMLPLLSELGHVLFEQNKVTEALEAYEGWLAWEPSAESLDSLALKRLCTLSLESGKLQQAKKAALMWCQESSSVGSWFSVGVVCERLGENDMATEALSFANELDREHAGVWGHLALLCLRKGDVALAKKSIVLAVRLGHFEPDLFIDIAKLCMSLDRMDFARFAVEESLRQKDTLSARLVLSEVLAAKGYLDASKTEMEGCCTQAEHSGIKCAVPKSVQPLLSSSIKTKV